MNRQIKTDKMKIVIAPDSFKECCRAVDVARAIATGVRLSCPASEIVQIPLSDGGEGLLQCFPGEHEKIISQVTGPTGKSVNAEYIIIDRFGKKAAVIEMSAAAGIELISTEERNPLLTTTYGVGELILDAWHKGCRDFYIGLGGSATCDCGTGMAQALGIEFFDDSGLLIEPYMNASLNTQVKNISCKNLKIPVMNSRFTAICDVSNPLLGKDGAAFVFAAQKGANDKQILQIEQANSLIVSKIENEFGRKLRNIPGSGAAGGIGISLLAFLDGKLEPGINIILRITDFFDRVKNADLIITGEGSLDSTTASGKVISGIIDTANGIPVIALCGSINGDISALYNRGLTAAYSICPGPMPLSHSIKNAGKNLSRTAEQVMRTFIARQKN